ncbi:AAA family ATPase [Pseudomonas sp. Fl4BN2]|nr:AAA family ATPase [Pseudomonas sp. Fl4BN2]
MEILSVKAHRVWLELGSNRGCGDNRVDLLTGPNGSGKSEILSFLAHTFRSAKSKPSDGKIAWKDDGRYQPNHGGWADAHKPARVIAQTYSPFNRFPPPIDHESSLTEVYAEGLESDSIYVCAGLHKSTRIVSSSLSKHTLEQAIYRLSESLESVSPILSVMENLKLSDRFDFTYEARPGLRSLQEARRRGEMIGYLEERKRRAFEKKYSRSGLDQELRKENIDNLAALITEAFEILGGDLDESKLFRRGIGSIGRSNSYDYAAFQSLSLLRRLDLLTLRRCELTSFSGDTFDVANASSGQQQMLCSVIGLATALRNNSLVLIDEPELSLHPRWQQLYLDSLFSTLEPFHGCHVLIATHSPLIVQRGQALGAGVNQVRMEAVSEPLVQDGASVEATLQNVFDTPVAGSVHLANEIFSLITVAETEGDNARRESLAELEKLRVLYSDESYRDHKTLGLIRDAINLLSMDMQ